MATDMNRVVKEKSSATHNSDAKCEVEHWKHLISKGAQRQRLAPAHQAEIKGDDPTEECCHRHHMDDSNQVMVRLQRKMVRPPVKRRECAGRNPEEVE